MLAALEPPPAALRAALASARVTAADLRQGVERRLAREPGGPQTEEAIELADGLRPILRAAGESAVRRGTGPVLAVDVIDALLAEPALADVVRESGTDAAALRRALAAPPAAGPDRLPRRRAAPPTGRGLTGGPA